MEVHMNEENVKEMEVVEETKVEETEKEKSPQKQVAEIKRDKRKEEQKKRNNIRMIVVFSLSIIFILIAIIGQYTFDKGSTGYEIVTQNIGRFFNIVEFFKTKYPYMIETVAIIVLMMAISLIITLITKLFTKKKGRSRTIANLISSIGRYACAILAIFLVLDAWGVQTTTLLAGAGILGLTISFGAQNLIDNVLSGFFIIFENQFSVGDIVEIDGTRGQVIEIGIRSTQLEDLDGNIHTINNATIRKSTNTSNLYTFMAIDIGLSPQEDHNRVADLLVKNLPLITAQVPEVKKALSYDGISSMSEHGPVLRVSFYTTEDGKNATLRKVNSLIYNMLRENNVKLSINKLYVD